MSLSRSVRRWIGEQKEAARISHSASHRAARELNTTARLAEEQAKIASYQETGLIKKLPARTATAPAIAPIRTALDAGQSISFRRGKRTITFNPGSTEVKRPVHDEGGLPPRRHRRRSPQRNQTPR